MTFDKDDFKVFVVGLGGKTQESNEILQKTNSSVQFGLVNSKFKCNCLKSILHRKTIFAKAKKKCCKHEYSIIYLTKSDS